MRIKLAIPGCTQQVVESPAIPPVGTVLNIHKHYSPEGSDVTVKVVKVEWRLVDGELKDGVDPRFVDPELSVTVYTELA
jgi:hypothetical protein